MFSDDSLTTDASRVVRLCKLILDEPLTFEWSCESRVDTVDRDLLRLMREAGCRLIHFGVETGVPFIMRKIGKGYDLEAVEQVVSDACSAGLDVVCSFIIGLPDDTVETIEETIKYARNLRTIGRKMGKRVITPFGILTPFPGTVVYEKSDKLGIRFLTRDWDRYNSSSAAGFAQCPCGGRLRVRGTPHRY
ncbi:MAG: radical SAM protein [Bacillota bacterium]|nr:radical SAM protein [Bacillota bacterium]